jgi:hypothetical protein
VYNISPRIKIMAIKPMENGQDGEVLTEIDSFIKTEYKWKENAEKHGH